MFLLHTVRPEEAQGKVAEIYGAFPKEIGVPLALQLMSASPGYLERQFDVIRHFMSHPNLGFQLLAAIRYVVAAKVGHKACEDLNGGLLLRMGMTPEELAALLSDPAKSPLEEREAALFAFVLRAFEEPASVTAADVEALRGLGYADSDVFDALAHAAGMQAGSVMYKAFARA